MDKRDHDTHFVKSKYFFPWSYICKSFASYFPLQHNASPTCIKTMHFSTASNIYQLCIQCIISLAYYTSLLIFFVRIAVFLPAINSECIYLHVHLNTLDSLNILTIFNCPSVQWILAHTYEYMQHSIIISQDYATSLDNN